MKKNWIKIAGLSALSTLFLVNRAYGAFFPEFQFAGHTKTPGAIASVILTYVVELVGMLAVAYLVYGGIAYLTSAGSEEGVKKAKGIIMTALIGIVIVVAAYVIVNWLSGVLIKTR